MFKKIQKSLLVLLLLCPSLSGMEKLADFDPQNPQVKENRERLLTLYMDFLKNIKTNHKALLPFLKILPKDFYKQIIPHLTIDLPIEFIEYMYKLHGYIHLRNTIKNLPYGPYENTSHKLLIGCGNGPVDLFAQNTTQKIFTYVAKKVAKLDTQPQTAKDRQLQHAHEDYITISPDLALNPTYVCILGLQEIPYLIDHSFTTIRIANTSAELLKHAKSELLRLTTKKGKKSPQKIFVSTDETDYKQITIAKYFS